MQATAMCISLLLQGTEYKLHEYIVTLLTQLPGRHKLVLHTEALGIVGMRIVKGLYDAISGFIITELFLESI